MNRKETLSPLIDKLWDVIDEARKDKYSNLIDYENTEETIINLINRIEINSKERSKKCTKK